MTTIIFDVLLFIIFVSIISILVYGIFKFANNNVYKHLAFKKKMTKIEFGDFRRKYRFHKDLLFTFIGKCPAIFSLGMDEYGDKVTRKDLIGYYQPDEQILYYGNPLNEICKELEIY